jgi:hypothetical protein
MFHVKQYYSKKVREVGNKKIFSRETIISSKI